METLAQAMARLSAQYASMSDEELAAADSRRAADCAARLGAARVRDAAADAESARIAADRKSARAAWWAERAEATAARLKPRTAQHCVVVRY